MTTSFIDLADQGKHQWWRYILGIGIILICWLGLGSLPYLTAVGWIALDDDPSTTLNMETGALEGVDPVLGDYLLPNLAFPFFLLGTFLATGLIHKRPLRTLVTPKDQIAWLRVAEGFGLWFALALLTTLVEVLLFPNAFRWRDVEPMRYLGFAMLAAVLTSLQTTTEELFFRGYLLQGMGQRIQHRGLLSVLNGLLFMLPHVFNPEVGQGIVLTLVYYWAIGAFFAWITLKDNGLELALGMHAANNLFVALMVNAEGSALYTPALVTTTRLDPLYNLLSLIVMASAFYAAIFLEIGGRREQISDL